MWKTILSVTVVLLLAVTLSIATAVPLQAASSQDPEDPNHDFWTEYLKEGGYAPYTVGFNSGAFSYSLTDLNNDGCSELLLNSYEKNAPRSHTWIFTRDSKGQAVKVLEAITLDSDIYYSSRLDAFRISRPTSQKHELSFYTQAGSVCEEFIRLNGTKISTVATFRHPQDGTVDPQPAGIFSKGGIETRWYPWNPEVLEIRAGVWAQWQLLMPEKGTVVPNAQELSSYIGSDVTAFRRKFHCNDLAGTGDLYYTNHIIRMEGHSYNNTIYCLSLGNPGCPYSLMGVQAGMTAEEAIKIIREAGGHQIDPSSEYLFELPNDLVLRFSTHTFQSTERIVYLTLCNRSDYIF